MSNIFKDVSHDPTAMALDLRMFKQAPVALSYVSRMSLMTYISFGTVTKILASSVYVTTAVVWVLCPILIPVTFRSNRYSNGFKIKAKSSEVIGQPYLTEHRTGKGPAGWPLICTNKKAWSFIAFVRAMKRVLYP
jgi:hypothetical protein